MDSVLKEFPHLMLPTGTTKVATTGKEKEEYTSNDKPDKVIRNITINQTWVDRARDFTTAFFEATETSDVDQQFRRSEYTDFETFLEINGLHFFESYYIKPKLEHQLVKAAIVQKCFNQAKHNNPDLTEKQFCHQQNMIKLKDSYIKINTKYPKSKLLEIIRELDLVSLADSEGILTVDLLENLFQSKTASLKFMLALYLSGLGGLLTTDNSVLVFRGGTRTLNMVCCPIGLVVDKGYLKVLEEWTNMTLDYITTKAQEAAASKAIKASKV